MAGAQSEHTAYYYQSHPKPVPGLLDVDGCEYIECVVCRAKVRVLMVDPKLGAFRLRMKCHWSFRTHNTQEDTEIRLRGMPGIRMPALTVDVEESRVWKDLTTWREPGASALRATQDTVYWRGTSTFYIGGSHRFRLSNFPYDRQVINLEHLNFVWRPEMDSADHYKSMKVVHFDVETTSLLPEWTTPHAFVTAIQEGRAGPHGPGYAQRFSVQLRLERQHWFYVRQICMTTYLITMVTCAPLALPPRHDKIGVRLAMYLGGLVTLTTFKYGIADRLPSVPYATFLDDFLNNQIVTVSICIFEGLVSFRIPDSVNSVLHDAIENAILVLVVVVWTAYLLIAAVVMPRWKVPWDRIMDKDRTQTPSFELDSFSFDPVVPTDLCEDSPPNECPFSFTQCFMRVRAFTRYGQYGAD